MAKIRRALISVFDKTGLIPFAQTLVSAKIKLISTGGTARALREAGLKVTELSDYTGFPEMLDGRVKTLHPKVHGALLYLRGKATHEATAKKHKIEPIDLVVVNLYPFEQTVSKPKVKMDEAIENIDVGGPAMLRSPAKVQPLGYGENPHQRAALYGGFAEYFRQLLGKELSYNNILDLTAAANLISEFEGETPTLAILKHTNPCGVGQGNNLRDAWDKAFATDTQAPFGGIIAVNKTLDLSCARAIAEIFSEVIVAP